MFNKGDIFIYKGGNKQSKFIAITTFKLSKKRCSELITKYIIKKSANLMVVRFQISQLNIYMNYEQQIYKILSINPKLNRLLYGRIKLACRQAITAFLFSYNNNAMAKCI